MKQLPKFSVVLPSYNPDEKLVKFIETLEEAGIDDIIVINDGSKPETLKYFPNPDEHPAVTILTHPKNRGKGAGLKSAFDYFLKNRPDRIGVVTADGDGQHKTEDVIRCAEDMATGAPHIVIGARDFSLPDVPERSRKGNRITSAVFKIFVGMKISDTQTGLRAIPKEFLPLMLTIEGDRYEYETNMLLKMKEHKIKFTEVKIATVYIDENQTSHFRPVRDSFRIYYLIFGNFVKYTLSSILSLIVEEIIQATIFANISIAVTAASLFVQTFLDEFLNFMPARVISSFLNFFINKTFVFKDKSSSKESMKRYYILWAVQALVTILVTTIFREIFVITSTFLYVVVTVLIKLFIFFISFKIQKAWVFKPSKKDSPTV